ncbi:hypothetical protein BCR34DRAFT_602723 [Clohesyomyces aquaticus]|uniref:C2H2-type domain-containing protein n=1 Tax=Clohesyomyces aquaticus TaxID=1231657 RepID=A0A1Y1ZH68_9PLEO|nr:hypothetical protein BCR34DRAFT_602723 [Clohesyomyces aquaticus]
MSIAIAPPSSASPSQTPPPQPHPPRPPPSTISVSPLNSIPTDIATHRVLLFALDTPVQLTPAVWSRFWPYIDNVWCVHQKPQPSSSTGIAKIYGGCRLNRKTNFPPPAIHEKSRPRQRREGGTCKAKFRLTIYPDGRRVVERMGEGHSHSLEEIDAVKRNSGVRGLVLDSFFKSWEAGGILAFLRDTSAASAATSEAGNDILKDAGGLYLSRQEVQNILNGALKKAYPGQDVAEVKRQMDKYKNYTTCNFKGCSAPAFPDIKALMEHRRAVHGLKSHDHSHKMYSCPDKACWRRKKSKGFATLLGLEEHVREKHGGRTGTGNGNRNTGNSNLQGTDMDMVQMADQAHSQDQDLLDPLMTNQFLPLAFNISSHSESSSSHSYPPFPMLSDPITPDSSNEDAHIQSQPRKPTTTMESQAEEANKVLGHMEKEAMKIRIKRLMIERQKLDAEIKRLNFKVWGDERGEVGTAEECGNANTIGSRVTQAG